MRPGAEGREPGRRWAARSFEAGALDMAQEAGELDGEQTQKWDSMAPRRRVTVMAYEMSLVAQGFHARKGTG
jgi:hypothetical protein